MGVGSRGKRLNRRWLVAVPIVSFWLVMMAQLLWSEVGVKRVSAAVPLRSPTESWLGIYLAEGQRVGDVHLRQTPETRHDLPGVRMALAARMRLQLLGKDTDLEVSGSVWRPDAAARAEFDFSVRSAGFDFQVEGEVDGGELRGQMVSAGEVVPLRLPVDDELVFSSPAGSALRFPRLDVGDEIRLDSFDPLTLSKSEARVRCTARELLRVGGAEISTCRLKMTTGGLSSQAWIDAEGEIVRAETPVGLVLERLTPAQARQAPAAESLGDATEDLLGATAIRPSGRRPFRSARSMKARLGGVDALTLPEDRSRSALGGGVYLFRSPEEPAAGTAPATYPPEVARNLEADAFVQSDHERIRRQAAAIVGAEADPWRRSLLIYEWVFSRLDKEPVVSIPSALEVLEQKRGDCNEHTVLFTALARAAAIPTRIAIGVVWSDELEGFYYHAWPEVHVGDWIPVDPTLGQPVADATHVKLLSGGIETWPRLLPFLGKLEIEVLDVE
jgi:Transglutaminase-like superfamily